jgi:hypothetical protein
MTKLISKNGFYPTEYQDRVLQSAADLAARKGVKVEYVDGGTMEERMRAEGWWDKLDRGLRRNMRRNGRVILHVDPESRVVVGYHFERIKRKS